MMKLPRYRTIDDLDHGTNSAIHTAQQKRQRQQEEPAVPGLAVRQWSALYSEHWPYPSGRDRRGSVPNAPAHTMDFPTAGEVSSATHTEHTQATVPAAEYRVSAACRWAGSVCWTEGTTCSRQGIGHTWTPEGAGQTGPRQRYPQLSATSSESLVQSRG